MRCSCTLRVRAAAVVEQISYDEFLSVDKVTRQHIHNILSSHHENYIKLQMALSRCSCACPASQAGSGHASVPKLADTDIFADGLS